MSAQPEKAIQPFCGVGLALPTRSREHESSCVREKRAEMWWVVLKVASLKRVPANHLSLSLPAPLLQTPESGGWSEVAGDPG